MRHFIAFIIIFSPLYLSAETSGIKIRPSSNSVALTFDDGPDPSHTVKILGILERFGIHATFFVVGTNAKAFPNLIKAIHEAGHVIANHSYRHPFMSRLSPDNVTKEFRKTNDAVIAVTGKRPKCMRPPYGDVNERIRALAKAEGLETVLWDLDSNDHKGPSPANLSARVLSLAKGGNVILMHDLGRSGSITERALPAIIEGLKARGLSFETICE